MIRTRTWQATNWRIGRRRSAPVTLALRLLFLSILPLFAPAAAWLAIPRGAARADEQPDAFIQGLRERGLEELALDYLDRMQTSRLASGEFKGRIPYYRGMAELSLSRRSADPTVRDGHLARARAELERFAAAHPDSSEAADAQIQLGGVLLEIARQQASSADRLPAGPAQDARREQIRQQCREQLAQADKLFQAVAAAYTQRLQNSPLGGDGDEAEGARRPELRARAAQAAYLSANVRFEIAQTYPPQSPQFKQQHEAAARLLSDLADQYSSSQIWGYYARLDEGRCYQALEQYPLALGCYHDVLSRSSVLPAFRTLISRAYTYQAQCQLATGKLDAAIEGCRAWLADAKDGEDKQPEWLQVRFQLAEALRRKAEGLPEQSIDRRRLTAEARDAYRLVAASYNSSQSAARAALVALRGEGGTSAAERLVPKTFVEAHELGKEALSSANAAKQALPIAERNNPEVAPELKAQYDAGMADARHYLRAAMSLVDDETDRDALNEVRYFLSWLYWDEGDYYRAAVLSHFLASRYPNHSTAAAAARIAIASYDRLAQEPPAAGTAGTPTDANFASRRAVEVAEFVLRRWPGSRDAEAARSVLVNYAIRGDRIDEAERLIADLPAADRPKMELQLGIAMWPRALEQAQRAGANKSESAEKMKTAAIGYLRRGLELAGAAQQINESTVAATIYLAQAMLHEGNENEAIQLLENPQTGPLVLLERKHEAVSRSEFAIQAYETALRAYVSANPPRSDKVSEMVDLLESAARGSGSQSVEQMTRVYLGLGLQLQRQIEALRDSGRSAEADRVSAAFAQLLDRIAAQSGDASWSTRQWVAQSYFNLAMGSQNDGADGANGNPAGNREHLLKARGIYQSLLDNVAQAPPPSEPAHLAARFQHAECSRALGEFQKALDAYSELLKEKESSLAVQRAAALAYEERGQKEGGQWLERAIFGGYQLRATGENLIWGWLKLSQMADRAARSDEKYRDSFFEARYHMARCRYLSAVRSDATDRKDELSQAKQSIQSVARLYPELGGPRWKRAFEALLKQIQTASGEEPVGLREFVQASLK